MATELVPVLPGRPAVVRVGTTSFYVSVHDREHLAQRLTWKRRLALAHPDKGGTNSAFVTVRQAQERWFVEERTWYRLCDLEPPAPIPPESFGARGVVRVIESRTCQQCQIEFPSRASRPEQYCGRLCANRANAGRGRQRGDSRGNGRLTSIDVIEIRRLAAAGTPRSQLVERYAVDERHIGRIVRGEAGAHLLDKVVVEATA